MNEDEKIVAKILSTIFKCDPGDIGDVCVTKKGMTNNSFTFLHDDTKYIFRLPGEGTEKLINRHEEFASYQSVMPLGLCDDVVYFDPNTGYKVTVFWENARVCDPMNFADVRLSMEKLRDLHNLKIKLPHSFDIFERIDYYESLWNEPSCYSDYETTKAGVMGLKHYLDGIPVQISLTHLDAVPDNILFLRDENGEEEIRLIDWEYSAMQDPHVDIAMFAVYSMYDKENVDKLIDCYFKEGCSAETRNKLYAYIAMCGLMWSNWCEFKRQVGRSLGEYAIKQYEYAKDYVRFFAENVGG